MIKIENNHYMGLDILRIISALIVLFSHIVISNNYLDENEKINAYIIASIGVEIFFCLSGFLICRQGFFVLNNKDKIIYNFFCFIARRIMRTWPAYFFVLLCFVVFYKNYTAEIIFYMLFIQNLYYPLVSSNFFEVSWSITVEEIFYIVFPLILVITYKFIPFAQNRIKKDKLVLMVCIFIVLTILTTKFFMYSEDWGAEVRRVAILRLDAIAIGGVSYYIFMKYKNISYFYTLNYLVFFLSFLLAFLFLHSIANIDKNISLLIKNLTLFLLSLSGASLVIIFSKIKETYYLKSNLFLFLANLAYPIYLSHTLIIDLVIRLGVEGLVWQLFFVTLTVFLVSLSIRHIIEKPIIKKRPNYA